MKIWAFLSAVAVPPESVEMSIVKGVTKVTIRCSMSLRFVIGQWNATEMPNGLCHVIQQHSWYASGSFSKHDKKPETATAWEKQQYPWLKH